MWKQYDAKDAVLQGLQQQYNELQQQYIQFQENNIDLLQRYNKALQQYNELQQQHSDLQQLYNEMLPVLIQHEKLKQQLSTLNQDLEKYMNSNIPDPFKVGEKDVLPEIELLYYQIGKLKKKGRRFF